MFNEYNAEYVTKRIIIITKVLYALIYLSSGGGPVNTFPIFLSHYGLLDKKNAVYLLHMSRGTSGLREAFFQVYILLFSPSVGVIH